MSDNTTFSPSCIECVHAEPVTDGDDIQMGDHIIYWGRIYDHHAIVVSVEPCEREPSNKRKRRITVIHASNSATGAAKGFFGFESKAKILRTTEERDFAKSKTMVVRYLHRPYTPEEIIQRAMDIMNGKIGETFHYNLLGNNCEHVVSWCVIGQKISIQVKKFITGLSMYWSLGWEGLGKEIERNKALKAQGLLCEPCFKRNEKLCKVPKREVVRREDINVGDIITYKYHKLDHDAIVMEIGSVDNNEIVVIVAHYAFCGVLDHRMIQEDHLSIPLDGSVTVTDYSGTEYSVYQPDEVVRRAKRRVGEQKFIFFVNDSCHFARWCKLESLR